MKRRYTIAQVLTHALLYPLQVLPEGRAMHGLRLALLRRRNSVPLYLVLRRGQTAVQVGTPNVLTLRRFSRLVGAKGRVVIVEADPDNAARLRAAIPSLDSRNVVVINKGAWSEAGELELRRSAEFDGDHRFDIEGTVMDNDFRVTEWTGVTVGVETLDAMLAAEGIDSVDYVSVTVNGAELEVLRGARATLLRSRQAKVFAKGHARIGDEHSGTPLHTYVSEFLESCGFRTVISRGERSTSGLERWRRRDGDVYAWRVADGDETPKAS